MDTIRSSVTEVSFLALIYVAAIVVPFVAARVVLWVVRLANDERERRAVFRSRVFNPYHEPLLKRR